MVRDPPFRTVIRRSRAVILMPPAVSPALGLLHDDSIAQGSGQCARSLDQNDTV